MYYETFCQKLKQARNDTGYTQRQVADLLNLKQPTLAGYETGRTQPDIETLGKLADFYEVDMNWLIGTKYREMRTELDRIKEDQGEEKLSHLLINILQEYIDNHPAKKDK